VEWYHYVLIVVGLAALLPALAFGAGLRVILSARIARGGATLAERERVPEHLRVVHDAAAQTLLPLGFEYSHTMRIEEPIAASASERWVPVYVNFEQRAYSEILPAEEADKPQQWHIEFNTIFTVGKALATVDGVKHRVPFQAPWLAFQDRYCGDLARQWQSHLNAVAKLQRSGLRSRLLVPEDYVRMTTRCLDEGIDALRSGGHLKRGADGAERFTFAAGLSYARRLWRGERRRAAMLKRGKPVTAEVPAIDAGVEADVDAYLRRKGTTPERRSWVGKAILFGISLLAFSLALGFDISLQWLVMIAGVVLFHELGHILGMYLFKYRDLQILFIPFLGAAAIGTQQNPKVYQRVIIDLLGPVPGVIVGLALLVLAGPTADPMWAQLGLLMLFLNYLNLLPIMPLDGGHVMNLILSGYHRYFQIGFQLLSVAVLAVLAWTVESVILGLLALLVLTIIPVERKKDLALRRLQTALAKEGAGSDEHGLLQRIFTVLRESPFAVAKADDRYYLARFLEDNAQSQRVTATAASVVLLVYAAALALPVAAPALWSSAISPLTYLTMLGDSPDPVAYEPMFEAGEWEQLSDIELRRLQQDGWHAYLSQREPELLSVVSGETRQYVDYYHERNPPAKEHGATAAQLAETETRLGQQLPASYRAFLLARDGWLSIAMTMHLANSGNIRWLRDTHPDWIETWLSAAADLPPISDEQYYVYGTRQDEYAWRREYLRDALLISDDKNVEDAILLLPRVRNGQGEWEAWQFSWSDGGARRYPSFAHLIAGQMVWAERQLALEYASLPQ